MKAQNPKSTKTVDEFGRILIPKHIRTQFGIKIGDTFSYEVDADKIILRRPVERCIFCDAEDDVQRIMDRPVCKNCIEKIKNQ